MNMGKNDFGRKSTFKFNDIRVEHSKSTL